MDHGESFRTDATIDDEAYLMNNIFVPTCYLIAKVWCLRKRILWPLSKPNIINSRRTRFGSERATQR